MKRVLRWERQENGAYFAYSGTVIVATVVEVTVRPGEVHWKMDGVAAKWITKPSGFTSSIARGRRAVNRGWRRWLDAAGLKPT